MKVKGESEVAQSCPTLSNPMDGSPQAPLSMGFSRQEYWSGVPLPSPNHFATHLKLAQHCKSAIHQLTKVAEHRVTHVKDRPMFLEYICENMKTG